MYGRLFCHQRRITLKIKNGLVFNAEHKMEPKDLCFENGIITEDSTSGEFDATGMYVLPGFIDTHIHGANGVEFYASDYADNPKPALDYLASVGVTGVLYTLATSTREEYISDAKRFKEANDDRLLGIHWEGPFVNPVRKGGMHPDRIQNPCNEIPDLISEYSGNMLKIFSIAPELDGAHEVIKHLLDMGVKVSIAHTDASFEEASAAADLGATRVTHTYNAMRPLSHRDPGVLGCALTDDRLECELICDMHHVSPAAVKLVVKAKGIDKVTMISDCSFFCGMPDGKYTLNGRELYVEGGFAKLPDGTISGSACSLATGAKNMFDLGYKPEEIAVMACVNPARAASAYDRGELKAGYRADIILLDKDFNVKHVFVKGKQIK